MKPLYNTGKITLKKLSKKILTIQVSHQSIFVCQSDFSLEVLLPMKLIQISPFSIKVQDTSNCFDVFLWVWFSRTYQSIIILNSPLKSSLPKKLHSRILLTFFTSSCADEEMSIILNRNF